MAFMLSAGLDPFQEELQARPLHLSRTYLAPVADEAARLQPLAPDAKSRAIEIQDLHLSGSPRDETNKSRGARCSPARGHAPLVQLASTAKPAVLTDPGKTGPATG